MDYQIIYLKETDSTNSEAARGTDRFPHGTVIVAEAQTAGRGRRGRSWVSEPGENLYFSVLLKPDFEPEQASMLTLVMAQAVAEGIEEVGGVGCQIKWPNDIVLHGRKICGILTEMQMDTGHIKHVIVGVGINVNQTKFAAEGLIYAGSLRGELGMEMDKQKVLGAVLERFSGLYEEFVKEGSLEFMQAAYEERLANRGNAVKVLDPKGEYEGTALGINDKGELLVRREDGAVEAVYAGEVSICGLWGYV